MLPDNQTTAQAAGVRDRWRGVRSVRAVGVVAATSTSRAMPSTYVVRSRSRCGRGKRCVRAQIVFVPCVATVRVSVACSVQMMSEQRITVTVNAASNGLRICGGYGDVAPPETANVRSARRAGDEVDMRWKREL